MLSAMWKGKSTGPGMGDLAQGAGAYTCPACTGPGLAPRAPQEPPRAAQNVVLVSPSTVGGVHPHRKKTETEKDWLHYLLSCLQRSTLKNSIFLKIISMFSPVGTRSLSDEGKCCELRSFPPPKAPPRVSQGSGGGRPHLEADGNLQRQFAVGGFPGVVVCAASGISLPVTVSLSLQGIVLAGSAWSGSPQHPAWEGQKAWPHSALKLPG